MTTKEIRLAIENVIDETTGKTLKESSAIRHIGIDPEKDLVVLIIAMGKLGGPLEIKLRRELAKIIKIDLKFTGVKIQLEEQRKIDSIVNKNVKFIMIISGKGGVGKSTVACNIAYALTRLGKKVAIIDADIYGASVPRILEMEPVYPTAGEDGKIIPFNAFGMELISTEFFSEAKKPVIWRGSMLNSMINNFFYDVKWDRKTDYVIIDCPPGTGDIALDLRDIVPDAQAILVTTPHTAASNVALKAGAAATQMNHTLIGVVENMSYYINPISNEPEFIFGQGGGREVANWLNSELLAQIPVNQPLHHLSLYESDEEIGKIYDDLATLITIR